MKLTTLLQTSFIGLATADFWIYHVLRTVVDMAPLDGYQIWDSDPACTDVWGQMEYPPSDDVSGDKTGVRCVSYDSDGGCYFRGDATDIDIMEVNFSGEPPVYHWTTYKNVDYPFTGVDNVVYGHCTVATDADKGFSCPKDTDGGSVSMIGKKLFYCKGINGHVLPSAKTINQNAQWQIDHPDFPVPT